MPRKGAKNLEIILTVTGTGVVTVTTHLMRRF